MKPQVKRILNDYKKNVKKKPTQNSSWFHQADKVLINGFWYAKISDIKFGQV